MLRNFPNCRLKIRSAQRVSARQNPDVTKIAPTCIGDTALYGSHNLFGLHHVQRIAVEGDGLTSE